MSTTWQRIKRWPNSGQLLRPNGDVMDVTQCLDVMREGNIQCVSLQSNLYRTTWRSVIPQGQSLTFVQIIPEGIEVRGHSRVMNVFGGRVDDEFYVGGTFTNILETVSSYNFDERSVSEAASELSRVEGWEGGSLRSQGILVASGTGANRTAATQTQLGAVPQFDSAHQPVFRFTNAGTTDITFIFELTFSEYQIEGE